MLKTYLYIPDHLNTQIVHAAARQKKSKAEIIRYALEKGMGDVQKRDNASSQAMLKLADIGEKYQEKGPKDLSKNVDHYIWGMQKK
ncbi:MAG: hypothetical protein AAB612_03920 [Patescibacteria group bacterium]